MRGQGSVSLSVGLHLEEGQSHLLSGLQLHANIGTYGQLAHSATSPDCRFSKKKLTGIRSVADCISEYRSANCHRRFITTPLSKKLTLEDHQVRLETRVGLLRLLNLGLETLTDALSNSGAVNSGRHDHRAGEGAMARGGRGVFKRLTQWRPTSQYQQW